MPQALFVPDDSQLMSYLGQSTQTIECVHMENRGGEREGREHKKKRGLLSGFVMQQMLQICSKASRFLFGITKH